MGIEPVMVIGSEDNEHIALALGHTTGPDEGFPAFVMVPIAIRVEAFTGDLTAELMRSELVAFRDRLQQVYETLAGTATLTSITGSIALDVHCESRGTLSVHGQVDDNAGNRLRFTIGGWDQSHLPSVVAALDEALGT